MKRCAAVERSSSRSTRGRGGIRRRDVGRTDQANVRRARRVPVPVAAVSDAASMLLTGAGIVPPDSFTLAADDRCVSPSPALAHWRTRSQSSETNRSKREHTHGALQCPAGDPAIGDGARIPLASARAGAGPRSRPCRASTPARGRLVYVPDEQGNTIHDASHAGYRGGGVAIPTVPVRETSGRSPATTRAYSGGDRQGFGTHARHGRDSAAPCCSGPATTGWRRR